MVTDPNGAELDRLLDAMLPHVVFDGWSAAALKDASAELGLGAGDLARLAPRGAPGLAAAAHRRGDRRLAAALGAADLSGLRFRDRIARAVRQRISAEDREVVRRSTALFALPHHAGEGARLIWETADTIWTALGDSSDDINWYTKRLTLAGVYSSVLLYWLGDSSDGAEETWAFLDRRIEDVMRIEGAKAGLRKAPLLGQLMEHPLNPLNRIRAPGTGRDDWRRRWPGRWQPGPDIGPASGCDSGREGGGA